MNHLQIWYLWYQRQEAPLTAAVRNLEPKSSVSSQRVGLVVLLRWDAAVCPDSGCWAGGLGT